MRKSVEADKKAEHYEHRAEHMENDNVISSDDPNAIEKLQKKLEGLERNQGLMKACNKIIKNKKLNELQKVEQLVAQGLTQAQAIELQKPDFCGRIGFASFSLTNNNATINTTKKRISFLQSIERLPHSEEEINGVKMVINPADNRVQLFFPGKPSREVLDLLKHGGFHYSPRLQAHMRQISNYAIYKAREILKSLVPAESPVNA